MSFLFFGLVGSYLAFTTSGSSQLVAHYELPTRHELVQNDIIAPAKEAFNPNNVVLESIRLSQPVSPENPVPPVVSVPPVVPVVPVSSPDVPVTSSQETEEVLAPQLVTTESSLAGESVPEPPKVPDSSSTSPINVPLAAASVINTNINHTVRFLYVVAADEATPSNAQGVINDLAASLPSYYFSQIGKSMNVDGVAIVKGAMTAAQYQVCPVASNCTLGGASGIQSLATYYNLVNEFKLSNYSTIIVYSWGTDGNTCRGWGGPIAAIDNLSVSDYGIAAFSGTACATDAIHQLGAHESGHSFGLVHTCDGTMMDGCGTRKPLGYGAPLNASEIALLRDHSPYFKDVTPSVPNAVASGSTFVALDPARIMESRSGYSTKDGQYNGIGIRAGGTVTEIQVAGRVGVPNDALAVALNVAVVNPLAQGFAVIYPCDISLPGTAGITFNAGATISNATISRLGNGKICVYSNVTTDIVIDVNGVFPSASSASFTPINPARVLETRGGSGTADDQYRGIGKLRAGTVTQMQIVGRVGVPGSASSVSMNLTAITPSADGFITVYPCDIGLPNTVSLNYKAGTTISNAFISKIGNGSICIYSNATTDLVIDVNGAFNSVTSFKSIAPARMLDSRPGYSTVDGQYNGIGQRQGGTVTELQIAGRGGIPADALAVSLNLAVVDPTAAGYMVVYPCGTEVPNTSNVNYMTATTTSNFAFAKLSSGKVCIWTNVSSDLVVDVNGAFTAADTQQLVL